MRTTDSILNLVAQWTQLLFSRNIGEITNVIQKYAPKSIEDWRSYYYSHVKSEAHIEDLGKQLFERIDSFLNPQIHQITEQYCIDYIKRVVINQSYNRYVARIYSEENAHLTKIHLQNYRSFEDTGEISINTINFLVGANSCGKSSILKFFPLLKQSVVGKNFNGVFSWYADDVDFKDFKNTLRNNAKIMTITFGFSDDCSVSFEIMQSKEFFDIFKSVSFYEGDKLLYCLKKDELSYADKRYFLPIIDITKFGNVKFAILQKMSLIDTAIASLAKRIIYVKPIRANINRYYRLRNDSIEEIESDGSNLPMFLYSLSDDSLKSYNAFLYDYFGFEIKLRRSEGNVEILILEKDGLPRNAVDMGYGYTELLPILTTIWNSLRKQKDYTFIVIEQPEVHLHPKFQSKFAKMLCKVIKNYPNLRFFIETHSETILNAVGREIDYKRANPNDINVLLIEKDKNGISTVKSTGYDNDGYLKDWPVNFLDEDAD